MNRRGLIGGRCFCGHLRRTALFALSIAVAAASACTDDGPDGPGKLTVNVTGPGALGAVVLELRGVGVEGITSGATTTTYVHDIGLDALGVVVVAESQNTLQNLADWLTTYQGVIITVEGHCDERGTREYNLALGARRASAARDYLIALGVNPNRIDTISYGKERPAVLGSNESAWAQNRRGVFLVN